MSLQQLLSAGLFLIGSGAVVLAVQEERRMQHHRQPGVSYWEVTLRRDGAWRRADLFTPEGLAHQRRAARLGLTGAAFWVAALGAWMVLGWRSGGPW